MARKLSIEVSPFLNLAIVDCPNIPDVRATLELIPIFASSLITSILYFNIYRLSTTDNLYNFFIKLKYMKDRRVYDAWQYRTGEFEI